MVRYDSIFHIVGNQYLSPIIFSGESDLYLANNSEEEEEEMEIDKAESEVSYTARDGTTWVRLSSRPSD